METNPKPSFANKVSSFFKKRKLNADPVSESEQQREHLQPTAPEWISIYGHGFHNGVYRIEADNDSFPGFLNNSNDLDKTIDLQKLNMVEVEECQRKLRTAEEDFKKFTIDKIAAKEKIEALSVQIDKVEIDKHGISDRNRFLSALREQTKPEYGWIPAILFLIAGMIFIWGDVTVTIDITSKGFDMKEEDGRMFAIGLALTVFLIKPLLDRMFEKPFQKAGFELNKAYKTLLFFITGLGIVMLFFLGQFRSEAKTSISKLSEIYNQQAAPEITERQASILQSQANNITTQLADNWWGRWGMVLSAIVFAIGGAMCLSVCFPSLTTLTNRYWFIPFRRWTNKVFINRYTKTISALNTEYLANRTLLANAESRLSNMDLLLMHEAMVAAKKRQLELIDLYYQVRQFKENNLYKDGFNRGDKYSLEGDLKFKIFDPMALDNKNNGSEKNGHSSIDPKARNYTRRPFVKIRKMIADNYNKKQNHTTQDGTEFEILT